MSHYEESVLDVLKNIDCAVIKCIDCNDIIEEVFEFFLYVKTTLQSNNFAECNES